MDCILTYDNVFEINYVSFRAKFWIVCSSSALEFGSSLVRLWVELI